MLSFALSEYLLIPFNFIDFFLNYIFESFFFQ